MRLGAQTHRSLLLVIPARSKRPPCGGLSAVLGSAGFCLAPITKTAVLIIQAMKLGL